MLYDALVEDKGSKCSSTCGDCSGKKDWIQTLSITKYYLNEFNFWVTFWIFETISSFKFQGMLLGIREKKESNHN